MSSSVSEEAMDLYKFAAPALCKKADVKSDLATALVGAIVGGGVGYAANKMTPDDEDEDKKKRLLSNVLAGAAMGGLGGYGLSRLGKRVNGLVDRPGWFQRNWPEFGWRHALGLGALGSGAAGGHTLYYTGLKNWLETKHPELIASTNLKLIDPKAISSYATTGKNPEMVELAKSWNASKSSILNDIRMIFSKAARNRQLAKDQAFQTAINTFNSAIDARAAQSAGSAAAHRVGSMAALPESRKYLDAVRKARSLKAKAAILGIFGATTVGASVLHGINSSK